MENKRPTQREQETCRNFLVDCSLFLVFTYGLPVHTMIY